MKMNKTMAKIIDFFFKWRLPFASAVALLFEESLVVSLANFQDDLVPSLNSKTGRLSTTEMGVSSNGE